MTRMCSMAGRTIRAEKNLAKADDMIIGVPKEVKDHESRVGIVPSGVKALVDAGHQVIVETKAGALSSMPDADYQKAGASIVATAAEVWTKANIVVKVKEP